MIKIYEAKTDRMEGRDSYMVTVGVIKTPLAIMDRTTRQKTKK